MLVAALEFEATARHPSTAKTVARGIHRLRGNLFVFGILGRNEDIERGRKGEREKNGIINHISKTIIKLQS